MASRYIVGLDVGSSSVKIAVAERLRDGRPVIRHLHKEPSRGLRKGVVIDIAEVSQAVARCLADVKKFGKSASHNIYVGVGSPQLKVQASRGITAVSRADSEIYQDDIDRVVRASQAVNLPPNRMVIHNVTSEYLVDGVGDIAEPLGLSGNRLEVASMVIDVFAPHVKGLLRAVELAGGSVTECVITPLVGSRATLSKRQKDVGTVLIDVGSGTTGMIVYEENKLVGVALFPIGANNITNDIAVGLKIPVDAAEKIKLDFGYAMARGVSSKDAIELKNYDRDSRTSVSRRFVVEIIESRLAEIFQFVHNELKQLGRLRELPGGAVFVGGGSKLPGITDMARQELNLTSQIGVTIGADALMDNNTYADLVEDPEYVNAIGLVLWGSDKEGWQGQKSFSPRFSLGRLVKYFLP